MYFSDVTEIRELKGKYRRLASRFHPDRGGAPDLMIRINREYETVLASLKAGLVTAVPRQPAAQRERRRRYFQDVQVGQIVFVNGTECEVLEINDTSFRVVARGRTRQTWFNKNDGRGRFNKELRAAWVRRNRRR